jgi:hypothetical protein
LHDPDLSAKYSRLGIGERPPAIGYESRRSQHTCAFIILEAAPKAN